MATSTRRLHGGLTPLRPSACRVATAKEQPEGRDGVSPARERRVSMSERGEPRQRRPTFSTRREDVSPARKRRVGMNERGKPRPRRYQIKYSFSYGTPALSNSA